MTSRRYVGGWPWLVLVLALMLAVAPIWRLAAVGFEPTLDQLLQLGCFRDRGQPSALSGKME